MVDDSTPLPQITEAAHGDSSSQRVATNNLTTCRQHSARHRRATQNDKMADTTARPEDVDIGQLGSMFGVQTRSEPDYLEYDIRGRGYMERLFFNCGASYLGFMLGGGVYGTVKGCDSHRRTPLAE